MTRKLQILRGTTAQNNAYTGAVGELTMDTDRNEVRIHDGQTVGGIKISDRNMPILTSMFFDHITNDMSWLRADTFSWQSGDVYKVAYEHLASDYNGATAQTETIGGTTVAYYLAEDGHKICLPDQESNLVALYEATGVAWYYLLDTENKQFKLPRTKYGFAGMRDGVGNYVPESLPNIVGAFDAKSNSGAVAGAFVSSTLIDNVRGYNGDASTYRFFFNASGSSSTYKDGAPVQERATQMYLYFYVGNFEQSAIEQTAGITAETLNGKVDLPTGKAQSDVDFVVESQLPTSANGYTWYRKYKSGWVEQGGLATIPSRTNSGNSSKNVSLPVQMANSTYSGQISYQSGGNYFANCMLTLSTKTQTSVALNFYMNGSGTTAAFEVAWEVKGEAKE